MDNPYDPITGRTVLAKVIVIFAEFHQAWVRTADGYQHAIVQGKTPGVPFESLVEGEWLEIDALANSIVTDVRRPTPPDFAHRGVNAQPEANHQMKKTSEPYDTSDPDMPWGTTKA